MGFCHLAGAQRPAAPQGAVDSLVPAFAPAFSGSTANYTVSEDSLDAPVDYEARDSMFVNLRDQTIDLYGEAQVKYQDINLKANHITLDYGTNVVTAEPWPDSSGTVTGNPNFADGGQTFEAKRMIYNFKSGKGIVYETVTTQDDIFVRGGKSKFVTDGVQLTDTTSTDVVYTEGAIFTTCSADHPHFGIRTSRAKMVPNKLAIIGPSYLEIMGVPMPIGLPFGFFPLKSGRSSGLLFPSDYQYRPSWGFGLEGIGWFFPIGEQVNLSLTGDIYANGTFRARANGSYNRRYKYTGSFEVDYSRLIQENDFNSSVDPLREFPDKGFSINWTHRMSQKAHPTFNFGGSIRFQTNQIDQRFQSDYATASENVIRSSMNATKQFVKIKSTLTAGLNHSQNNQTGQISVNFPDARFQTQTIYPFRNIDGGTPKSWWKKASFRYRSALRTQFEAQDTAFFDQPTFDNGQYGFEHNLTSALSLNVLKYFNVSPNITYGETYYGKRFDYGLDPTTIETQDGFDEFGNPTVDTTSFATIVRSLDPGLASFREFSASVSVSTQLFGKVKFKRKGILGLKGLRHVMKPSVSVGYRPDYRSGSDYLTGVDYFVEESELGLLSPAEVIEYEAFSGNTAAFFSPFAGQIFGGPPTSTQGLSASYNISNLFEAKVYNRKDSTDRNVKLFQNIGVSGNYDFAVDTLNWSAINIGGSTQFFKGVTRINIRGTFDPYVTRFVIDPETLRGRAKRIDVTTWKERNVPFQMNNFSATISTNITVAKIRQLFQGEEEEYVTDVAEERRKRREEENSLFEETDLLSLFEKFSIVHTFSLRGQRTDFEENLDGRLPIDVATNSLSLRGAINLTENWTVNIGQIGYDFDNKTITYPYLNFVRDLHCWEMRLGWAPQRNVYQFSIAVKPGTLDFLSVPINRNRYDPSNL